MCHLHSASDSSVPRELRGKYGAFALQDSRGGSALSELRAAGLTHVHLMPAYDFATVPERPQDQLSVQVTPLPFTSPAYMTQLRTFSPLFSAPLSLPPTLHLAPLPGCNAQHICWSQRGAAPTRHVAPHAPGRTWCGAGGPLEAAAGLAPTAGCRRPGCGGRRLQLGL